MFSPSALKPSYAEDERARRCRTMEPLPQGDEAGDDVRMGETGHAVFAVNFHDMSIHRGIPALIARHAAKEG